MSHNDLTSQVAANISTAVRTPEHRAAILDNVVRHLHHEIAVLTGLAGSFPPDEHAAVEPYEQAAALVDQAATAVAELRPDYPDYHE